MRLILVLAVLGLPGTSAALACDPVVVECLPPVVAFPAYTPEGLRVGTVVSPVRRPLPLELSPYTGQPITVVYDNPGRVPGSVGPGLALLPLPRVDRFHTRAVYPRGY